MEQNHSMKLMGKDHSIFGEYVCSSLMTATTTAGISAGSTIRSPSMQFKGDSEVPNEDALLAYDDGQHCVLAVADAHFGWESSHQLIDTLHTYIQRKFPQNLRELLLLTMGLAGPAASASSKSTLLINCFNREKQQGYGVSFGDSSSCLLQPDRKPRILNWKNSNYISPANARSLDIGRAEVFEFRASPGSLLLAYTDGVDECHYRRPESSVQPRHLDILFHKLGPSNQKYADFLMSMALMGVDGHPGGQDNIALVVTTT